MNGVLTPLIFVLVFIAVAMLTQAVAETIFSSSDRTRRINRRLTLLESGLSREETYSTLIQVSSLPELGNRQVRTWLSQLDLYRRQANVAMPLQRIAVLLGSAALALWTLSLINLLLTARLTISSVLMTLIGAVTLAVVGTYLWLNMRRSRRLKQIEEQLPMALDIMNRALRAGHPVVSAMQLAATEIGDPLGTEFGLVVDETVYGKEFSEALSDFAIRVGSDECHFFAVSVSIQAQTGGNLSDILDGLATVMRARATLGRRVRTLASEGKATAIMISSLVPLVAAGQMLIRPTIYSDKFNDPGFWPAVQVGCLMYFGGIFIISRLINFKY